MNTTWKVLTAIFVIICLALVLIMCTRRPATIADISSPKSQVTPIPSKITPVPVRVTPNRAGTFAQATMDTGRGKLSDLSRESTQVSLNITQAAATQRFIAQQTKIARDAAAAAQSSAATATQAAFRMNANQTAQAAATLTAYPLTATYSARALRETGTVQAKMILYAQATQAAQAVETLTAYPLTATPFAVTQAALLRQQHDREQQAFVNRFVTPLIPVFVVLDLVLFIVLIVWAYRRFVAVPWQPRQRIARANLSPGPLIMIDGVISDHDPRLHRAFPAKLVPANPPELPVDSMVRVEIINPAEPPVAQWIAEVEHQLVDEGGLTY